MDSGSHKGHGEIERACLHVATVSRTLASSGLVLGTSGNVSERVGDLVAVSPTGAVLGDLESGDVAVVELGGAQVGGPLAPTSELDLHLSVYREHDAGGVVHTHSPIATALSCVLDEVPCVHYGMLAFGGDVPVAPYETFGTPELAAGVVRALEGRTAALMASHGAVTFGASATHAAALAEQLEWACSVYWHARAVGEPHVLDAGEREAVVRAAVERGYGQTRQLDGEE